MRSFVRVHAITAFLVAMAMASDVTATNFEQKSPAGSLGLLLEGRTVSNPRSIEDVCTSSAENLVCCFDLGWYAYYVSRLAEEVTSQVVIINLGNNTVVNSTLGEIISMITEEGAGGNVLEAVSVVVGYGDDVILELTGLEVLGLLDNSVTVEDLLAQIEWTGTISGPEILNITITVNFAGAPIQLITIGDVVGEGDPTAAIDFISSIIENGPVIGIVVGQITVNNFTLAEIAEIFGLNGQVGPIPIDPSAILPSFDFPNLNLITPPPGWIIQMLDSSGIKSVPAGVVRGNFLNVGNFRQCLNTKADEPQSMQVEIAGVQLPLPATYFEGQYCWVYLDGSNAATRGVPLPPGIIPTTAGMCFPDSCSEGTLQLLLQSVLTDPMLNETLQQVGLPIKGIENCSNKSVPGLSTVEAITVTILVIFGVALIVGTIADYLRIRKQGKDQPAGTSSSAMKYVLAFSIIRNTKSIMDTSEGRGGDVIACLFGIRFISMTWVLLGHTYSNASIAGFETDPVAFGAILREWRYMPLMNAFPSVDTFFFMGGVLVAYVMLKNLDRHGLTWSFIPKLYLHRYLRLTPLYGFVMLISYAFLMRAGSGPFWQYTYDNSLKGCEDKWWHNLLYIATIMSPTQSCLGHGWYLSNDMLYFLATPFLVIPMYLAGAWGSIFSFLALGGSVGILAAVHSAYDAPGAMPVSVIIATEKSRAFLDHVYFKPHTRFGVYIVGLLTGFLLYRTRRRRVQLPGGVVILGWMSAMATGLAVIYGLFERENEAIDEHTLLAYGMLHRQAWGFALAWVVFACVNGYGGFINTFLSWSAFRPLGRLAYASYLVHLYVVAWNAFSSKTQKRRDDGMQIYIFIGNLIITHALAFCAAIAIEFPLGTISNMLLGSLSNKLAPPTRRHEDYYTWKQNGLGPSKGSTDETQGRY